MLALRDDKGPLCIARYISSAPTEPVDDRVLQRCAVTSTATILGRFADADPARRVLRAFSEADTPELIRLVEQGKVPESAIRAMLINMLELSDEFPQFREDAAKAAAVIETVASEPHRGLTETYLSLMRGSEPAPPPPTKTPAAEHAATVRASSGAGEPRRNVMFFYSTTPTPSIQVSIRNAITGRPETLSARCNVFITTIVKGLAKKFGWPVPIEENGGTVLRVHLPPDRSPEGAAASLQQKTMHIWTIFHETSLPPEDKQCVFYMFKPELAQ